MKKMHYNFNYYSLEKMGGITSIEIFIILYLHEPEICPYPQANKCSPQPSILHCLQIIKCVGIIHRSLPVPPPPRSLSLSLSLSGYAETPGNPDLFHRG